MNMLQFPAQVAAKLLHDSRESLSASDLEILHGIMASTSAQQCNDLFWTATKRFQTDKFACGEIDLKNRDRVVFYSMQWSESWRRFYLEHFLDRDPLLRFIEDAEEPLTWSEWRASKRLTAEEKAAFHLVGQHGWVDGFALPVPRRGSHIGLVSVVCRRLLEPCDKLFLTHASFCYLERIRTVITPRDFPVAPLGMAPRELECLRLVAQGHSDREIGKTLNISISTAHEHVQGAMKRVGVKSRAEAVALAIAFGAIRL